MKTEEKGKEKAPLCAKREPADSLRQALSCYCKAEEKRFLLGEVYRLLLQAALGKRYTPQVLAGENPAGEFVLSVCVPGREDESIVSPNPDCFVVETRLIERDKKGRYRFLSWEDDADFLYLLSWMTEKLTKKHSDDYPWTEFLDDLLVQRQEFFFRYQGKEIYISYIDEQGADALTVFYGKDPDKIVKRYESPQAFLKDTFIDGKTIAGVWDELV